MNLNYPYDRTSMKALTLTADKKLEVHNLVVDFDGEVVLDPEIYFPGVPTSRYMFCTQIPDEHLRDELQLASLYDALDEVYNSRGYAIAYKYIGSKGHGRIAA